MFRDHRFSRQSLLIQQYLCATHTAIAVQQRNVRIHLHVGINNIASTNKSAEVIKKEEERWSTDRKIN